MAEVQGPGIGPKESPLGKRQEARFSA